MGATATLRRRRQPESRQAVNREARRLERHATALIEIVIDDLADTPRYTVRDLRLIRFANTILAPLVEALTVTGEELGGRAISVGKLRHQARRMAKVIRRRLSAMIESNPDRNLGAKLNRVIERNSKVHVVTHEPLREARS